MTYHNESRTGRPKRSAKARGEAPQDTAGALHTEVSTELIPTQETVPETVHSYKRLTRAQEQRIIKYCLIDGMTQKLAAEALGCSDSTVSRFLAEIEESEGYAEAILKAATPDAATAWAKIARTSKNHLAAKDLLLHTGVIRPLETEGSGAKVQILIGQPGSPVTIQSTQVIEAVKVSSKTDGSE